MKITKEFIMRNLMDEYILIPTGKTAEEFNGMITLTETAAFIYNHIEKVSSLEELLDLMSEEYKEDRETMREDTIHFINHMLVNKMIAFTEKDKGW